MKSFALSYISTAIVMLGLDSVWLSLTGTPLYRARLGELMLPQFVVAPALCFYALYVFGLVVLIVLPALALGRWQDATWRGGLLGCVAYATYDLTNEATLRGWSPVITLADIAWGTTLSAIAATAAYAIVRTVQPRPQQ